MPAPKSMQLFFIDNQGEWPNDAKLVGDLVVWPDKGKYPSFTPVALASAADFDGRILMLAGNRGLVVAFCPGAKDMKDVRRAMSAPGLEQYRISLEGIIQRMLIHRHDAEAETEARDGAVNTVSLLTWLARSCPSDAKVLVNALKSHLKNMSKETAPGEWQTADELVQVLEAAK